MSILIGCSIDQTKLITLFLIIYLNDQQNIFSGGSNASRNKSSKKETEQWKVSLYGWIRCRDIHSGEHLCTMLTDMIQEVWLSEVVPQDWCDVIMEISYKSKG